MFGGNSDQLTGREYNSAFISCLIDLRTFFPVAIAALALLHFAFGAFGLLFASAVGFGFRLELV